MAHRSYRVVETSFSGFEHVWHVFRGRRLVGSVESPLAGSLFAASLGGQPGVIFFRSLGAAVAAVIDGCAS